MSKLFAHHKKKWIITIALLAALVLAGGAVVLAQGIQIRSLPGSGLPSAPVPIASIATGNVHSMVITEDGNLWAWGANAYGQLGDGTTTNQLYPVKIMEDVAAVSAGTGHTMAVTSDGTLWAWGNNSSGQLGNGTTEDHHSPIRIMDGIRLPQN